MCVLVIVFSPLRHRGYQGEEKAGRAYLRELLVFVESSPALSAEPSSCHVAPQEWAGPVLGIPEAIVQDLHDMEAGIQTDEVGECQRAHRVVHSQLHDRIDLLG